MATKAKPKYEWMAEGLQLLAAPVDGLMTHPRNSRMGDVGAIIESLKRFGQQKPIVAQKRPEGPAVIIAGNHLFKAALELGWTHIAVVIVEMDDKTALSYMVADNRTQELGHNDDEGLANLLSELAMSGDLAGTGYEPEDVDDLLSLVGEVPSLEDLAEEHGEPDPEKMWPLIRIQVSPETLKRWEALWKDLDGGTETERLNAIIDWAEAGRKSSP